MKNVIGEGTAASLRLTRRSLIPAIGLSLAGCSSYIPISGPKRQTVINDATIYLKDGSPKAQLGYALIAVNASVVSHLEERDRPPSFASSFLNMPAAQPAIGPGDTLSIEIFEAHAGGLFIPQDAASRPGNFVQLQPEQVDSNGNISVPYAGSLVAAGLTPQELGAAIRARLKQRALDPQVLVSVSQHNANDVSILGDVNNAARFQIQPGGERLLSALARAGGPKSPDYETMVQVQRGGRTEVALLSEIAKNPRQDIQLQPGDVIYVSRQPRYFSAVGATGQTTTLSQLDRRFAFQDYNLSLNDALARAGGLQDDRANVRGVFLFREERSNTLKKLGLNIPASLGLEVPTIYMVDLSTPSGLFYCKKMGMRNNDTIYVSNAPATDLTKFISAVMPWTQSASYASSV